MDPPITPEPTENIEEIRYLLQLDIDNASYCAGNQSLADFLDRVSETVSEVPPNLLEKFNNSLNTERHNDRLWWVKVLRHAESIAKTGSAIELIERFLEGPETATHDEQMKAARTVMRDHRDVLRKLAE